MIPFGYMLAFVLGAAVGFFCAAAMIVEDAELG